MGRLGKQVLEGRRKAWGQRRRVATVAVALLAVGAAYSVVFGHNGLTAYERKKQETVQLQKQLETLTRENETLKGHVDRLSADPDAIEHQAREELHYTRPGEVIVTLPNETVNAAVNAAANAGKK